MIDSPAESAGTICSAGKQNNPPAEAGGLTKQYCAVILKIERALPADG